MSEIIWYLQMSFSDWLISKEHKHLYVHCNIIYNLQDMEAAEESINRWVDKTTMGLNTMEFYSAIKKKSLPFATVWMDLENIILSEFSPFQLKY